MNALGLDFKGHLVLAVDGVEMRYAMFLVEHPKLALLW
jgi:hypothetical protein